MMTVFVSLLLAGAMHDASATSSPPQSDETCVIVRISPEGRRTVIDADDKDYDRYRGSARVGAGRNGASASVSSSGASSSSSSVSVSSSSRNGRSMSSATARDDDGERTVTTTHDQTGCTTVIDERPAQRSDR